MAEDTASRIAALDPEAPLAHRLTYRHIRRNIAGLLAERPAGGAVRVPACPGWTVRDTVAHLVRSSRVAERALRNAPPRYQATLGRLSLPELLAEWERSGEQVELLLGRIPPGQAGSVLVMDAFTHEFDIARALEAAFPSEHPALPGSLDVVIAGFHAALCWRCLPALSVEAPGGRWTVGEGPCVATVSGERLDLYRSLAGRRTTAQIRALSWSVDPEPWLPAFAWGPFRPPGLLVE